MAKPMTCFLVTISNQNVVTQKVVDDHTFTIGRSLEAAISIVDPNISRNHVRVSIDKGQVQIEDLASANGTFVNDAQIAANTPTPFGLQDRLNLGMTQAIIRIQLVERTFSRGVVDSAPNISNEDRQYILSILDGAKTEAERLVLSGKEMHNAAIQQAKVQAEKIMSEALSQKKQIEAEWTAKKQKLDKNLLDIEAVKKAEMAKLEAASRTRVEKLEDETKIKLAKHQEEVEASLKSKEAATEEAIQLKTAECNKLIEKQKSEAKIKADLEIQNAREQVELLQKMAKDETGLILERARLRSEEEAQEYFQTIRDETIQRMKSYEETEKEKIESARKNFENERAALLKESEKQLSGLRVEKRRLEKEMKSETDRLKSDIDASKIELRDLKSLIEKQKKLAAEEIEYQRDLFDKELKAELDDNKKAMAAFGKQKQEEVDKLMKLREEETDIYIREKTFEFEKMKRDSESKVQEMEKILRRLEPEVKAKGEQLAAYKTQEEVARVTLAELAEKNDNLKDAVKSGHTTKNELDKSVKEAEEKVKQLAMDKANLEQSISLMKSEYEKKIAMHRTTLAEEFESMKKRQDDELNTMRLAEIEKIKNERELAVDEFNRERKSISREILNFVMDEISNSNQSNGKSGLAKVLSEKIDSTLEDRSLSLVATYQSDRANVTGIESRRKKARRLALLQGMLVGSLVLLLFQFGRDTFLADSNPVQTQVDQKAKERDEDLARRKFNPPQDSELRPSYKDSVIYTKDFVSVYESSDFQKKFIKELTVYLLKHWRIDEDKSVEALSVATTLVKTLHEKKEGIHPDFIPDGLKKMEELEAQSTEQIKNILGTEVRFEAFKKFETKFYQQFINDRLPAKEKTNYDYTD